MRAIFDDDGSTILNDISKALGNLEPCTSCIGKNQSEFRATILGTLQDEGNLDKPPTIKIMEVDVNASGCSNKKNYIDLRNMTTKVIEPELSQTETSSFARFAYIHGSLMIIGWGIIIPCGALVAKFLRYKGPIWFELHMRCMMLGLLVAIIGVGIAIQNLDSDGQKNPKASIHAGMGLIVMLLGILQPVNAALRPHLPELNDEEKSKSRIIWEYFHKSSGMIALLLAVVTISIGTTLLPDHQILFQIAYPVIALSIFLYIINYSRNDSQRYIE